MIKRQKSSQTSINLRKIFTAILITLIVIKYYTILDKSYGLDSQLPLKLNCRKCGRKNKLQHLISARQWSLGRPLSNCLFISSKKLFLYSGFPAGLDQLQIPHLRQCMHVGGHLGTLRQTKNDKLKYGARQYLKKSNSYSRHTK